MAPSLKTSSLCAVALFLAFSGQAQEQANAASSSGTLRPIPVSDQMFRKMVWRTVDLREKQNQPLFSNGREITRILLDAVQRGELQAYKGDSLTSTFTAKEVKENSSYKLPDIDNRGEDDGFVVAPPPSTRRVPVLDAQGRQRSDSRGRLMFRTERVAAAPVAPPAPKTAPYLPRNLNQMSFSEEMIFDKKRSRMYCQIKTISLYVPGSARDLEGGIDKAIGTFKYSDVMKVFRSNPQSAIWFNAQNDAQHKNMADAFELRLFNSYITKVSNPSDMMLQDIYSGGNNGILAAQQTAADLVEYEYNLWSF